MKISEFSVKNSLFVNLLSVFFIFMGVVGGLTLNREVFPTVDFDIVLIAAPYPGATARDVEKLIATPIEEELKEVDDIEEIRSVSGDNLASIYVKLNPDAEDKNKVVNDIQRAVDKVKDLPEDAEDPLVKEINTRQIPVLEIAISGDVPESELQGYAESLENLVLNIPEVAKVERKGWRDREIWVEVDPEKLREYYVSPEEIMRALSAQNINLPAGTMRGPDTEYLIRTSGEFLTAEEIADTVIRASDIGNWLRVKDVAVVRDAFADESEMTKSFGARAINLVVLKKENVDSITIVEKIQETIKSFKKSVPEIINIYTLDDLSIYIRRRLGILRNNGIVGILMVLVCLRVFLSGRVAFFTAMGIPIAFSITFAFMLATGININMITLFGLIIVLGMIVDDGIIVSENTYRYIEKGMPPKEAAVKGTEEVIPAVTTTIITTIVAFLPLAFMSGIMGKFMRDMPIVVIAALTASLFEAFVILPSHLADFARPPAKGRGEKKTKNYGKWFRSVVYFYTRTLKTAVRNRYRTIAIFTVAFVLLIITLKLFLRVVMFPHKGIEEFYLRAEAPIGTSLDKTAGLSRQLEKLIEEMPDEELDSYVTTVGSIFEGRSLDPYTRRGSHLVQINVYLTPKEERTRKADDIISQIRGKTDDIKGFEKIYFEQIKGGPPTGKAVDVRIKGEDYGVSYEIAKKMTAYLESLKGVTDIDTDYKFGNEEITVVIDEKKASEAYLTASDIARAVRNAVGGGVATAIKQTKAEEEIDVLVRFPREYRQDVSVFKKIVIPNKFNNLIDLDQVATFRKQEKLESYKHLDGKRAIRVTALVDEKNMTSVKANELLREKFKNVESEYLGYSLVYGGEEKDTQESLRDLGRAFIVAFFLIFLILATKFNSLVQPFIIMTAIVFGVFGALLALLLHNMEFSFMAFLGIVGLVGVVVNDSIVLVDFINRLRLEGAKRRLSIVKAGTLRLRPVMLTTITTVVGLAPVGYGIGGLDEFLQPAAITLSWGLLFGTVLTLVFIPCVYAVIDDITLRITHHATVRSQKRDSRA